VIYQQHYVQIIMYKTNMSCSQHKACEGCSLITAVPAVLSGQCSANKQGQPPQHLPSRKCCCYNLLYVQLGGRACSTY
jgi:hypothetical protein